MANVQKYSRGSIGHIFGHYDRTKPSDEIIRNPELTKYNYNLCEGKGGQLKRLRSVIGSKSEGVKGWAKCLNRADVNVFCTWAVTMPKDLPMEYEKPFFEESYKFLADRYGVEGGKNIISAYVHKDEKFPHMHFCFVPCVKDKKKDVWKVSAKEVIDKVELQKFHRELKEHLERALGVPVNVVNGATIEGNKSVAELRKMTASGEVQAIKEQAEANKRKEQELSSLSVNADELKREITDLQKQEQELEQNIISRIIVARPNGYRVVNEEVEEVKKYLSAIKENTGIWGNRGNYTISKEMKEKIDRVIDGLEVASREVFYQRNKIKEAEERIKGLAEDNATLRSSVDAFENLKALVGADVWKRVENIAKQEQKQARQSRTARSKKVSKNNGIEI